MVVKIELIVGRVLMGQEAGEINFFPGECLIHPRAISLIQIRLFLNLIKLYRQPLARPKSRLLPIKGLEIHCIDILVVTKTIHTEHWW